MTSSTGTVVFNDAKLQAIDVVATERLGVGTLDPASNLHVVGNVHVTGNVNKLNFTDGYTIKRGANVTVFGTTDVIQEITGPHARHVVPLRKYPEVAMNTKYVGGYVASASSELDSSSGGEIDPTAHRSILNVAPSHGSHRAFNHKWSVQDEPGWATSISNSLYDLTTGQATSNAILFDGNRGEYIDLALPRKIKVSHFTIRSRVSASHSPDDHPASGYLYGSNDGSNWTRITSYTGLTYQNSAYGSETVTVNATEYYDHLRLTATARVAGVAGSTWVDIGELEYYGYEETSDPDTSVDTKITSQFNLPDTTGVKLYVDGDKGSTATDFSGEGHTLTENNATYDSAEKAWEFSSLSTSNVTMTSGDLAMEGTHPHSVSLWFNAANVSSNATLFHVGTAAGEGDAKTAISLTETGHLGWIDGGDNQFLSANTWHNLVYATQGGGGVRTCYLDGRKLGDVQVQDTFGDYPPFAMTGYSEYGYTASANNEFLTDSNNIRPAWGAHNPYYNANASADGGVWMTEFSKYSGSSPYAAIDGDTFTDSDGGTHTGHWNKIEMSHKLVPSYVYFTNGGTYYSVRMATNWVILGSNDDSTWDLLLSSTTTINQSAQSFAIDTSKGYKYLMFLCKNINGDTALFLEHIRFYGHKENDTTRFPVSSTVLKYPHIAMTGQGGTSQNVSDLQHAQRGYEVTGSSMYVDNASNPYQPWRMFDDIGSSSWWASTGLASTYGGGSGAYGTVRSANLGSDSGGSATPENGEWVKIKLQHAIVLSHIVMVGTTDTSALPKSFKLYGSNNGTSWTEILAVTGASSLDTSTGTTFTPSSTPSAYKHFGLVITQTQSRTNYTVVGELKLYGTEEDLDVVARVGEGLDGKVANFRVYDKYLHEEQALELWDAQKDQFGRAESSVVVHKGRLGVGTTEPEGRFAVLDEAGEMGEFPPKPMMAAETYMEGHGNFKACASSYYGTNPSLYQPYAGFKRSADPTTQWNINTWNSISPSYSAATKQVTSGASLGGYAGEWLKLSLPYGVKLGGYQIMIRSDWADYGPEDWVIIGSNDDTTWHLIASVTAGGIGSSSGDFAMTKDFIVETTKYYKHLALVCSAIHGGVTQVNFTGLRYFGTRERGQSTLHDGSLTLTKNLTVPRIGPALDADDTPRRDRLVVEYNTSTNPTANGTVKDTSGRGNDGLFYGGASYDATEKVLDTPNSTGIIGKNINLPGGNIPLSVSAWFRLIDTTTVTNDTIVCLGTNSTATGGGSFILRVNTDQLRINFEQSSNYTEFTKTISNRIWYHVVATYDGGTSASGRKLFIDGVEIAQTSTSGTITGVNLPVNPGFTVGMRTSINGYLNGSISQFKLYDTALTADEVKRLYDMGRLGNVIAQPVHIAAPLYAPGTIVQVESSTKSDTFSATGYITHPLSPGNDVPGLSVTIHPKFASSKILISYDVNMGSYGRAYLRIKRTQGGNVTAIEAPLGPAGSTTQGKSTSSTVFGSTTNSEVRAASFTHYDDANSIVPITYQIQAWTYHSTYYVYINRAHQDHDGTTNSSTYWARTLSSITAKEVCQ